MAETRIEWIDRMKGLLILLVILGHSVGMAMHHTTGIAHDLNAFLYKFIYLFHMPAFFFLSGLTFRPKPWREFLRSRAVRLLPPYFAFGIISIMVFQVMMALFALHSGVDGYYVQMGAGSWWHPWLSLVYGASFPGTDGFRCNSVLWFLPCLLTVQIVFRGLIRLRRLALLLVATLSVPLFVCLRRSGCCLLPWGLSELFHYLPYVCVGYLSAPVLVGSQRWEGGGIWTLVVSLCLFLVVSVFAPFSWGMSYSYGLWALASLVALAGVGVTVLCAMRLQSRFLSVCGACSIGIMMMHKWFILLGYKLGVNNSLLLFVVSTLLSLGGVVVLRRRFPHMV